MITHIYFDWGRTLSHPKSREIFIYHPDYKKRISCLYSDTIEILDYLSRSYTIGIISDTDKTKEEMMLGLKRNDMLKYFKGATIFTDGGKMYKGYKDSFYLALKKDKVNPFNAVMIGDKYTQDIFGAKKNGMYAILIDRKRRIKGGLEDAKVFNLSQLKEIL